MNPIDDLNKALAASHIKDLNVETQVGKVDVKVDIDPKEDAEGITLKVKL